MDALTATRWEVINRALTLIGDVMAIGIVVTAVNLGLLEHDAAVAVVGWALRALVHPSLSLGPTGIAFGVSSGSTAPSPPPG